MEAETKLKTGLKFDLLFWLHLTIVLLAYISPFVLDWKSITVFLGLHFLQILIFGNCVLTIKQFKVKETKESFTYEVVTQMMGFNFDKQRFHFILINIVPFVVLGVAIMWQEVLKQSVLINIF